MDMTFQYCPIIKGKINDIKAVAFSSAQTLQHIKPLFELPPFVATDTAELITARFATRLGTHFLGRPCYVDFPLIRPGLRASSGDFVLDVAYGQLNALNIAFEPVYGFDRDSLLWPIVIDQAIASGGMLLRLDRDDIDTPEETVDQIGDLVARGLPIGLLDVMIDCRFIDQDTEATRLVDPVADLIDFINSRFDIRKTIVAGSSALKTVSAIPVNSTGQMVRGELALWAHLTQARLSSAAIMGDYGVIHPDFSDIVPSAHINGKIRYTSGRLTHIFRGHSLRIDDRYDQYRVLASSVTANRIYAGSAYSYGDRYIFDCATGLGGTGTPGTWVLADQNHHLALVTSQIQRLLSLARRGATASELLEMA